MSITFKKFIIFLNLITGLSCAGQAKETFKYLKQNPPSLTPVIFAPDIISKSNQNEFGSVFSEDGTEFFYSVDTNGKAEIRYVKLQDSIWTKPEVIISHYIYSYNDPFLSLGEDRLYYISDMTLDGAGNKKDYDIWYSVKEADGWSKPINAGKNINTNKSEYYISFTSDGRMYFASNKNGNREKDNDFDIYFSKEVDGKCEDPIQLSNSINTKNYEADAFIAPDESYLIFCAKRKEGYGMGDLYISFKNKDGKWSEAKNMGKSINSEHHELCPFVTKDGKYVFFTSNKDIYWVSSDIINQYR